MQNMYFEFLFCNTCLYAAVSCLIESALFCVSDGNTCCILKTIEVFQTSKKKIYKLELVVHWLGQWDVDTIDLNTTSPSLPNDKPSFPFNLYPERWTHHDDEYRGTAFSVVKPGIGEQQKYSLEYRKCVNLCKDYNEVKKRKQVSDSQVVLPISRTPSTNKIAYHAGTRI